MAGARGELRAGETARERENVFNLASPASHHWENAKSYTHVFPTGPVKPHHRAWVGGYVHGGQLGVQAAIQERSSVLFTGSIPDWIGPSEGIAFN
jgi:hypothetical protein